MRLVRRALVDDLQQLVPIECVHVVAAQNSSPVVADAPVVRGDGEVGVVGLSLYTPQVIPLDEHEIRRAQADVVSRIVQVRRAQNSFFPVQMQIGIVRARTGTSCISPYAGIRDTALGLKADSVCMMVIFPLQTGPC